MSDFDYYLKPCPLCGHEVYMTYEDSEGESISVTSKDPEFDKKYIDVECVCGLCLSRPLSRIPAGIDQLAYISEIWNNRTSDYPEVD